MNILNNCLETNIISKSPLLKAADWMLTPCRKAFNGKNIQISVQKGIPVKQELTSPSLSTREKIMWTIVAVVTAPLAAIAALFKMMISPSVIQTAENPFKGLTQASNFVRFLQEAKISGVTTIYVEIKNEDINNSTVNPVALIINKLGNTYISATSVGIIQNMSLATIQIRV